MFAPAESSAVSSPWRKGLGVKLVVLGATGALAAAAMGGSASAATDGHGTTANVNVTSSISLTINTGNFTLTGVPGATVAANAQVTSHVVTNNQAGYSVTVASATETMLPADPVANTDAIPIAALSMRTTGATPYTALSTTARAIHGSSTRSVAAPGDPYSDDFQVVIPFVNSDTYSATLDYVATTL
jgi:hypothetical protein